MAKRQSASKPLKPQVVELRPIVGVDLTGKVVQLRQSFFKPGLKAEDHLFRCEGGYGCSPSAMGSKIAGTFTSDGEESIIRREHIEFVVDTIDAEGGAA